MFINMRNALASLMLFAAFFFFAPAAFAQVVPDDTTDTGIEETVPEDVPADDAVEDPFGTPAEDDTAAVDTTEVDGEAVDSPWGTEEESSDDASSDFDTDSDFSSPSTEEAPAEEADDAGSNW